MKQLSLSILFLLTLTAASAQSNLAPTTINGRSAIVIISRGSGGLASSGGYRIIFAATGSTYRISQITGIVPPTVGTFAYAKKTGTGNSASILINDSVAGAVSMGLTFYSANEATFSASVGGTNPSSQAGVAILEPLGTVPPFPQASSGLANLSVRAVIPPGGQAIPAFVLDVPAKVLIRVSGPALEAFGVTGAMADPMLTLLSGSTAVASNDNWNEEDAKVMAIAGAFPFVAGTRDSAITATLPAGAYTCLVADSPSATIRGGEVLIEVYRLP